MAEKDEDGNVNADGNVDADGEMDELLKEISNVHLSQAPPPDHEVEGNLGEKKETTGTSASCSLGVIQNISSDHHQVVVGSETSNQLSDVSSTTTSNVPVSSSVEATSQPSSSVITNVETESVPAVYSLSMPSSDLASKLPHDEDVTNPVDYTSSGYDETRYQLAQTHRNPQAMNPRYSQYQFPSGQYGNITRPPYLPPPALPFQQPGGSNMPRYGTSPYWRPEQTDIYNYNMPPQFDASMVPYGTTVPSPYWRPEQNDIYNYNMPPQFDATMVPYGTMVPPPYWRPEQNDMPQLGAPIVPYPYGSANRFGTWRGNNPANSCFLFAACSLFCSQGGDLNAWQPNQEHQQLWYDVSASAGQQNDRSDDPSDETQQQSPPRDN